ncbi:hypothetical protein RJT34_30247 [Clitoria ternatea]|uniref:Terpene synthase metal-binding domain-containing protein n=1 Tax=Clitoria ternatea TaxID=43366 RepID=A0AAN9I1T5_CLITE
MVELQPHTNISGVHESCNSIVWLRFVDNGISLPWKTQQRKSSWATSDPKIIKAASIICRLMDDIAGHEKRGHVASSLECYMKQHNTSRKDAIDELRKPIESAWMDINEECLNPTQVPMAFLLRVVNLTRMMDVLYEEEDSYTNPGGITKDYIKALLVNKIPL